MKLDGFTLIIPYYRNVAMLKLQLAAIARYDQRIRVVIVDDGGPEEAFDVIQAAGYTWNTFGARLEVYRILEDIPWNRGGARNVGATVAATEWIMHVDIDHLLPITCAARLLDVDNFKPIYWYRFPRYRVGMADETRKKDLIDRDASFGQIKPHIDSYLCTKSLYWLAGGYDEDYSGCLGGGSPFLQQLERTAPVTLTPPDVHLHVYTRSACPDASDNTLSRDTSEYSRRRKAKEAAKNTKAKNPLRFKWERVW